MTIAAIAAMPGSPGAPLTGPVSFPGADAPRLAQLFGGDRQALVDDIIGVADRLLMKQCPKRPACTNGVLRAMLSRIGDHSNRVWPSQEYIQQWLFDEFDIDVSIETISRAMRDIKLALGIGPILDRATVLLGPGPHQFPDEKRRVNEGIVPTWEMTPIYQLLHPTTVRMSHALDQVTLQALHPMPSSVPFDSLSLSTSQTYDPPPRPGEPPPLAPDSARACNVEIERAAERSQRPQTGPEGRNFDPSNLTAKTDYSKAVKKQAAATLKPSRRQTASDVAATMPGVAKLMAAVPGLQPLNALRWIRDSGSLDWLLEELVPYGDWQAARIEIRNRGGYLNNTLNAWIAERIETGRTPVWPDPFLDHLKRRKARIVRLISLPAAGKGGDPGDPDEGALPIVRALTPMEEYVALRPQGVVRRPPALDAAWKQFLLQAARTVPTPVMRRYVSGLVPIAWDPVTRQATLYCAFASALRTLQTHQNALSEALQAALGLIGTPSVRIRVTDDIGEIAGDGSPP